MTRDAIGFARAWGRAGLQTIDCAPKRECAHSAMPVQRRVHCSASRAAGAPLDVPEKVKCVRTQRDLFCILTTIAVHAHAAICSCGNPAASASVCQAASILLLSEDNHEVVCETDERGLTA